MIERPDVEQWYKDAIVWSSKVEEDSATFLDCYRMQKLCEYIRFVENIIRFSLETGGVTEPARRLLTPFKET